MPEAGGPANLSGVLYQNSVAALYLGRLCDTARREASDAVARVRVETPDEVGDIVVIYQDGRTAYVQAKERLHARSEAYDSVWRSFGRQFSRPVFNRGRDCLVLHLGLDDSNGELEDLCNIARTAQSTEEANSRIRGRKPRILERITSVLREDGFEEDPLALLAHVYVEVWSQVQMQRDMAPYWMPSSTVDASAVFGHLCQYSMQLGRTRAIAERKDATRFLESVGAQLLPPPSAESLAAAAKDCAAELLQHKCTFGDTGVEIPRDEASRLADWVLTRDSGGKVAVLVDQAGKGKTVVLSQLYRQLVASATPVLAFRATQLSGVQTDAEMVERLHLPDTIGRCVAGLADGRPMALLIDQIDALSLSLASDTRALDLLLGLVARLRLLPGVRIVLTCREFDLHMDPRLRDVPISHRQALEPLAIETVDHVLTLLGCDPGTLAPATRELLRVPLHLHLFATSLERRGDDVALRRELFGVSSLSGLFSLLWEDMVDGWHPAAPPADERRDAIRRVIAYMDENQVIAVPRSVLVGGGIADLQSAVLWLASAGLLVSSGDNWTLIHQTFFDYCYAWQFHEEGRSLSETVMASPQGLFERPQLIHVLTYLRRLSPGVYLSELARLFAYAGLRVHLRDLLFGWFGSLRGISDDEALLARRLWHCPASRDDILRATGSNPEWFARLRDNADAALRADLQGADEGLYVWLELMLEAQDTQASVIQLLRPYAALQDGRAQRLVPLLYWVRHWHCKEGPDLCVQLATRNDAKRLFESFALDRICNDWPEQGATLVGNLLDGALKRAIAEGGQSRVTVFTAIGELDNSQMAQALTSLADRVPLSLLRRVLPWLQKVVSLTPQGDARMWYQNDQLSMAYYDDDDEDGYHPIGDRLLSALSTALANLARYNREAFSSVARELSLMEYTTPQRLLARAYAGASDVASEEAFAYLVSDRRRLFLGAANRETARLIGSLYPLLNTAQQAQIEDAVFRYWAPSASCPHKAITLRGQHQLQLLDAIPVEALSLRAAQRLGNWRHSLVWRLPSMRQSPHVGWVGAPVDADAIQRMPDRGWLRAMARYTGHVEHEDLLKGGATELSRALALRVKEEPGRFYSLFMRDVRLDVDDRYVGAVTEGLSDSAAPTEWLADIVRRFHGCVSRQTLRTMTWALRKRAMELPLDVVDLVESWVRGPTGEDEREFGSVSMGDPYQVAINSLRGSALGVALDWAAGSHPGATQERWWDLVEYACHEPSPALRVLGVQALVRGLRIDRARALGLFQTTMDGCAVLLNSDFTQRFTGYAIRTDLVAMLPHVHNMLASASEATQEHGAALACMAYLWWLAHGSGEEAEELRSVVETLVGGLAQWRRGASRVFAANIGGACARDCAERLTGMLDDEDETVVRLVTACVQELGDGDIYSLRGFLNAYSRSPRALRVGLEDYSEYLRKHGILDPDWALEVTNTALDTLADGGNPWSDGVHLVSLVLCIYRDPTADPHRRRRAMDVFDRLYLRFRAQARVALNLADRR